MVTTLAGLAGSSGSADGTGSAARFDDPDGVAVDSAGNVYVADYGNETIREGWVAAPQIVLQPTKEIVTIGSNGSFQVMATGTSPLAYQWLFADTNLLDDARVTGSQSSFLTISNVQSSDTGKYQVIVTNAYGSATSGVATLTFLKVTPVITWGTPTPTTYGTALGTNQLNANASFGGSNVPGNFAYTPTNGSVLGAGTSVLSVIFTPLTPTAARARQRA